MHGFNVLVEKPMARNYFECADLIATAKERNLVMAVFQQTFLAPFYLETKKIIESGIIGDIKQISIHYNGFARRWDWQTLQYRMAGSLYNTGPHPVGLALDQLGFDKNVQVAFSKLDRVMTSGDAEDYVKIILTAPDKPVVDIEINSSDAFNDYKKYDDLLVNKYKINKEVLANGDNYFDSLLELLEYMSDRDNCRNHIRISRHDSFVTMVIGYSTRRKDLFLLIFT